MKQKTWNDIFFASCWRGDDPCYAMFLADEYIKRKRRVVMEDLIKAVEALLEANQAQRQAEDASIQAEHTDDYERSSAAYEDACATTIIRENNVRSIIQKIRTN